METRSSQISGRITAPRNSRSLLPRLEARGLSQFSRRERREIGSTQPRKFFSSEVCVSRLNLDQEWEPSSVGRDPWFTNVKFNRVGDRFYCSFGESSIRLGGWEDDSIGAKYESALDVIRDFQVIPSTDTDELVICGQNGNVIHGKVGDGGMITRFIGRHDGVACKLAVHPQSPHEFYSCGLDAAVHHYDLRVNGFRTLFTCSQFAQVVRDICSGKPSHHFYVPTIAVNPVESNYFCVGGYDMVARVYDIRMYINDNPDEQRICVGTYSPPTPHFTHTRLPQDTDVVLQSLLYSRSGELLVSYGGGEGAEQRLCLFPKASGFGRCFSPSMDAVVPPETLVYSGHRGTQGIRAANFLGPRDEYVVCGSTCGFIYIWEKKGAELVRQISGDTSCVYLVEPHPHEMAFASFGEDCVINMWSPLRDQDALPLPDNSETIEDWENDKTEREEQIERQIERDKKRKEREEEKRL